MIFARRALQRRLQILRETLNETAVNKLAARLNQPGRDRLAAMYEVAVLHGLSKQGSLQNEEPLPTGRRPDIFFKGDSLIFTADITVVSDEGLDDANPYKELSELVEKAKNNLGLPIGGVDLRVKSRRDQNARGTRTVLLLPPRRDLQKFVNHRVVPELREQIKAGNTILSVVIDDGDIGIEITINPSQSPFSQGGYASYDVPTIKDRNPLFNALRPKAAQLRGAEGVTGVIVGDGNCAALAHNKTGMSKISASNIASDYLRQYSSMDFVLLITVGQSNANWLNLDPKNYEMRCDLVVRPDCKYEDDLRKILTGMIEEFPKPVKMPVNAALRAREAGYGLGHHGGYTVSKDKIRLSSRELMEVLAGIRRLDDNGAKNIEASRKLGPQESRLQSEFQKRLREGRLPSAVRVIKTDENDSDDWVEFEFSEPDPAISSIQ